MRAVAVRSFRNTTSTTVACVLLSAMLVACSSDATTKVTPTEPPVVQDPAPTPKPSADVTVINDAATLATYVQDGGNAPIPLDSTPAAPIRAQSSGLRTSHVTAAATTGTVFSLVNQVTSPVVSGQTLEATHIAVDGDYVYVVYAKRGEATLGAVDVILVSATGAPTLKSRALFTNTEFYGVDADGGKLFLVGATSDPTFTERAVLEVVTLSAKLLPATYASTRIQLPSYAGTGVFADGTNVWVTSGNGGPNVGGLRVFSETSLSLLNNYTFADARGVHGNATYIVATSGTPGQTRVYSKATRAQLGTTVSTGGATIAESKGMVWVDGLWAFVAAGDGGIKTVGLSASGGTLFNGISIPVVTGVLSSLSTTNSLAIYNSFWVFTANGEAGVHLYSSTHAFLPPSTGISPLIIWLGRLDWGANISANFVATNGNYLFVAAGLGGLKILSVPGVL